MCAVVNIPLEQFSLHNVKDVLRLKYYILTKYFKRFYDILQ